MPATAKLDRRSFLKMTGLSGTAFILGFYSSGEKGATIVNMSGLEESVNLTPYIIIEKTGKIIIMNPRPEMGQGTYQSLPSIIAEELEISIDQISIKQTSGEKEFGRQVSGGSSSVRGSYTMLRKVGASAREMLIKAASEQWNVPVGECYAENGKVFHKPSGKNISYGELAESASKLEVPKEPVLKDPKDFKLIGKSIHRPDINLKVSGRAVFGMDVEVPGMAYASVERCPVFGSKLLNYDDSEAKKIKGVQQVVKAERVVFGKTHYDSIAVVADNYWAALQGRKALKVQWDYQGNDKFNSNDYEQSLRNLAKTEGLIVHNSGDFDKTFAESPLTLEAFYETPMVSHSCMEPMNCVAHWKEDNTIEVWVSSQGPSLIKDELSRTLGVSQDSVKVNIMFNGGGFGRRLQSDFASETAMISKAVGKPVKVIWTREDDTQLGPFRPMTFSAMKGAISNDGKAVAFQHKVISPSLGASRNATFDKTKPDNSMVEGISDQKYEIPNMKNSYVLADFHIPISAWRSVTSSTLAFAHECFIDEMAVKANKDPLAFRLEMLTTESDTKKVLNKLKEVSEWDKPLPKGWGRGIAQYEFFAGLCGQVVVVSSKATGEVKVEKVYAVIDLGTVVNPDNVKAQVEGGIVMGLVAATKDGIRFENGKSVQTNFHNNRMLRINEMPEIEVHIIADGGPTIKGVGEPGLPPLAPALGNAIYAATGKRMRRLPVDLSKIS
ncbi:MAG TPA: xanthine dehydrogenase family protein molybdopterin-binding subunit [Puia sp.]|nr:xanthine dehydrogenase family protein molybdopterin-binding subunit [Puia sp.]